MLLSEENGGCRCSKILICQKVRLFVNRWGFIDGTASCDQQNSQNSYNTQNSCFSTEFSGHKRYHRLKYQSVVSPVSIVASLLGLF